MASRESSAQVAQGGPSTTDGDPWMWVATAAYRVARAASYGPCSDADLRQLQVAVRAARGIADAVPQQRGVPFPPRQGATPARPLDKAALAHGRSIAPHSAIAFSGTKPAAHPVGVGVEHRLGKPAAEPHGIGPRTSAYYRGDQLPSINGKQLTVREFQILSCAAQGKSNENIGRELFVSEHTIKTHLRRLFDKIGAANRAHAVAIAFRQGALS